MHWKNGGLPSGQDANQINFPNVNEKTQGACAWRATANKCYCIYVLRI